MLATNILGRWLEGTNFYFTDSEKKEVEGLFAKASAETARPRRLAERTEGKAEWHFVDSDADKAWDELFAAARERAQLRLFSFDQLLLSEMEWEIGPSSLALPATPHLRRLLDLLHIGRERVCHNYWEGVARGQLLSSEGPVAMMGSRTEGERSLLLERADFVWPSSGEMLLYLDSSR